MRPQIHLRVLPKAQVVRWPMPWDVTEDPMGELTTRRMGQSFELGMLRPYQQGESVGRVSWRASARAGELVIQHFQQSGSIRLRVVVEVPREPSLGDPNSAGEQTIRLAAGVCDAALRHSVQLFVYLDQKGKPLREGGAIQRALAEALPTSAGLFAVIVRVAGEAAPGEQVAVVVSGACPEDELVQSLSALALQGCRVVVCIAHGRRAASPEVAQARKLQQAVEQAGFGTLMEAP